MYNEFGFKGCIWPNRLTFNGHFQYQSSDYVMAQITALYHFDSFTIVGKFLRIGCTNVAKYAGNRAPAYRRKPCLSSDDINGSSDNYFCQYVQIFSPA